MSEIGKLGGKISRRKLTNKQSLAMLKAKGKKNGKKKLQKKG